MSESIVTLSETAMVFAHVWLTFWLNDALMSSSKDLQTLQDLYEIPYETPYEIFLQQAPWSVVEPIVLIIMKKYKNFVDPQAAHKRVETL